MKFDRRTALQGIGAFAAISLAETIGRGEPGRLQAIEREAGGRLGVYAIDDKGRLVAAHRAGERFRFCSTFKAFLAGAVLRSVDRGRDRLDRRVPVTRGDIVFHSPIVEKALAEGASTVGALCAAAVTLSDNAAANLLLDRVGGPPGMTAFFRSLGGSDARLDRREPELNRPDGVKDTTTPAAAARMLRTLLASGTLEASSREQLEAWMIESPTGRARLRAGLPSTWRSGDKTGTGAAGETNDLAFVDVPKRGRVFIAAYYEAPGQSSAQREQVLGVVGRMITADLVTRLD